MLKVAGSLLCDWTQVSKKGRISSPRRYSSQSKRWRILSGDNTRHLSFSHRQWETKGFKGCDQKHKKEGFVRNWHPGHFCLLSKLRPSSCRTENSPHFPCSEFQGLLLWSDSHCFSLSLNSSTRNQVKVTQKKDRLDKEGKEQRRKEDWYRRQPLNLVKGPPWWNLQTIFYPGTIPAEERQYKPDHHCIHQASRRVQITMRSIKNHDLDATLYLRALACFPWLSMWKVFASLWVLRLI